MYSIFWNSIQNKLTLHLRDNFNYTIMKYLAALLLLSTPFIAYATTDEVDLDEEPKEPAIPPIKRSFVPVPQLFITDNIVFRVEGVANFTPTTLVICDSYGSLIYNATGYQDYNIGSPLQTGDTYSISLYIEDHHYTGIYQP